MRSRHTRPVVLSVLAAAALAACGTGGSGASGGGGQGSGYPQPGYPGAPTGEPISEPVPAAGGAVGSPDGYLLLQIPSGATPSGATFTVQPVTNLAPGGLGPAWRIGPEGMVFAQPVTLTIYAGPTGRRIDEITVAWQDDQGYWHRAPPGSVVRDPVANTLTVETHHLSSWTLTTLPTARDFTGTFSVGTSVGGPFVATGTATFTLAGEDAAATYYLLSGTLTLPSAIGPTTCVPVAPDTEVFPLRTNVAELSTSSPATFDWGASGAWHVSCADGSTRIVTVAFDTQGIAYPGCARLGTRPEVAGVDAASGGVAWDCSAKGQGQTTGDWDFASAACGTACVPADPCRTGTVQCGTGTAACVESGNVLDGTTCGADQVCSAGACVACVADVPCTPANACHAGLTSCSTGASVCVDQGTPIADGSTCGVDQVCSSGACVACADAQPCTPANACHQGVTSCATGTSVCVDQGALPDGTGCGTDLVCYAGACISCTQGSACASANPCVASATYECATGVAVCTDRSLVPAGTSCGAGQVCSGAGVCATCVEGAACSTGNPCSVGGTTACGSGEPVCTDTGVLPAGTACGTGSVCTASGQCLPCASGAACTPANPCMAGTVSCTSGTPVCVETTPGPAGTSCGVNQVCNGAGICNACVAGALCAADEPCAATALTSCTTGVPVCVPQAWLPAGASCGSQANQYCTTAHACATCDAGLACTPANPCAASGATSCSTGEPVCADRTYVAAGTSCGTDQVCSPGGVCTACAQGASCTSANPCAASATLECGSGTPVCADATFLADGASCGASQTCNAGACVASRTVTGTRRTSWWADAGTTVADPANGATSQVSALVADGSGGWSTYSGTMAASGTFTIPGVPNGTYWLRFQERTATADVGSPTYLETAATIGLDLGNDRLGRQSVTVATASTVVTFPITISGGTFGASDQIQLSSSNADVWDWLARVRQTGNWRDDFLNSNTGPALNLILAGDLVTLFHAVQGTDATSGRLYRSARRKADLDTVAMTNGSPVTTSRFTLSATGLANGTLAAATWNVAAFEALRTAMNLPATGAGPYHSLLVGGSVGTPTAPGPVPRNSPPSLFSMTVTVGASPTANFSLGALTYARVLPTTRWTEWREVSFNGTLSYTAPGAASAVTETVSVGKRELAPATSALAPSLSPVLDLRVRATSGAETSAYGPVTGVGLTPTLTWLAPSTGTVTSYQVEVFRLGVSGTASTSSRVATFVTGSTQVAIPPGVLAAGSPHYVRVTARSIASDPWATAPLRRIVVGAWSQTLSGTLTP